MNINAQTKISSILRKSPLSLYAIVQLSPKFNKLRNPVLRKVMAPRVNIEQAAKIGGCTVKQFFDALEPLGFMAQNISENKEHNESPIEKPEWLIHIADEHIQMLDVRPILEGKQDPLQHILQTLKMLPQDNVLCILNSFEPKPLVNMLLKKGYKIHVEKMNDDEYFSYFKKPLLAMPEEIKNIDVKNNDFEQLLEKYASHLQEIDVRNLEMPQPLLTILEKASALKRNEALYINHKRVPVYLLPELEEKGLHYAINEVSEGDVKMIIYYK